MQRILLLLPVSILLLSSCEKKIEDHLVGDWKLDQAYKKELFGRDYFQTGYEDGIFTFFESGSAIYINNRDTLTGYWKSDFWTRYNSSSDDTKRLKYLEIFLADFNGNKIINWRFDDFNFRNNWKCVRATEFSIGRDRCYEFVKP